MSRKDDFEGELSGKAGLLATWRALLESPAWKLYEMALKEQREARLMVLGEPSSGFGSILAQEFMKGEAAGIGLASKFPEMQMELLDIEVKRLRLSIELEEVNESEEKRRADGPRGRVDNEREWFGGDYRTTSGANSDQ